MIFSTEKLKDLMKKGTWFHGLPTEFFFCLLADFQDNRASKQRNRAGKVLNAAYTDGNFFTIAMKCYKSLHS